MIWSLCKSEHVYQWIVKQIWLLKRSEVTKKWFSSLKMERKQKPTDIISLKIERNKKCNSNNYENRKKWLSYEYRRFIYYSTLKTERKTGFYIWKQKKNGYTQKMSNTSMSIMDANKQNQIQNHVDEGMNHL